MPAFHLERHLYHRGYRAVAGVDEAGRGPLAGPLFVGAAILPKDLGDSPHWLRLVRDSKKLSPSQREEALMELERHALALSTGRAEAWEIDLLGLTRAIRLALERALRGFPIQPDYLLLDFMRPLPEGLPCEAIVKGDDLCYSIAAASIVAKVMRDRWMRDADRRFPGYGFARHKGYATFRHREALKRLGPCPIHRRSFAPVRALLDHQRVEHA